jgi:hypothetical protein
VWGFVAIAHDVRRSSSWRGKLAAVFGPPRWSEPATSALQSEPARGQPLLEAYALGQFLVLLIATVMLLDRLALVPLIDVTAYGALAALTLTGVAGLLEGRTWARRYEVFRLSAAALAAFLPGLRHTPLVPQGTLAIYTIASLIALLLVSVHLVPVRSG